MDTQEPARIIKLGNNVTIDGLGADAASFDDAFGEHSNFLFFGAKARARRAKRKLKRRTRRAKRKHDRDEADAEAAISNSQTGEEGLGDPQAEAAAKMGPQGGDPNTGAPSGDQGGGSAPSSGGAPGEWGSPGDQGGGGGQAPSGGGGAADDGSSDGSADEGEAPTEDGGGEESQFDGGGTKSAEQYEEEDFSGFINEDFSANFSADGKRQRVPVPVQRLVAEIARLRARQRALNKGLANLDIIEQKAQNVQAKNSIRQKRTELQKRRFDIGGQIQDLESKLNDYQHPTGPLDEHRSMAVGAAKRHILGLARNRRKHRRSAGGSHEPMEIDFNQGRTVVQENLKPNIQPGRIEITPTSSAEGEDNPRARVVELGSNAEGSKTSGINWKIVSITAVVAIAGVLVFNKLSKK